MSLLTGFLQGSLDTITATGTTPAHGSISISDNIVTYTPNSTYEGNDSFNITLNCDTESATVTVQNAPLIPISINVIEHSSPYADVNFIINVNGVPTWSSYVSASTIIYVHFGDIITCESSALQVSSGDNPELNLTIIQNTTTVFNTTVPDIPPVSLPAGPFTANLGDTFTITTEATAQVPSGSISCGMPTTYSGGAGFPNVINYTLGTGTGTVSYTYNAFDIPDKFIGYVGGIKVFDTGYRGDSSYQSSLNAALTALGLPTETITGPGAGSSSFSKLTPDAYARVEIYSPLSGTAWNFQMNCPV